MKKAINASIFKSHHGDCSNNGISSRFSEILIEHPQGWIKFDEENPPENLCQIVRRELWGEPYWYVAPVAAPTGVGYMYGGCIVDSSDSRWRTMVTLPNGGSYPLRLHDRCESQEEYDTYSR